ncbi:hypothetical protein QTP70_020091 [Hemibagrus guttatus]|uniref:Retrotransposon gag domain-containing protein n=1 Tax=Hemibagrus guttatus TaxID=175788 RepID=A0AAE0RIT0_9TELE|nr:hypothetical protein QTP70_020091 [Hemibagrus guttatus]
MSPVRPSSSSFVFAGTHSASLLIGGGDRRPHPPLPPLGGFWPSRAEVIARLDHASGDVAWLCCSAVDVAQLCCSAVDIARPSCSAVDVARRFCSALLLGCGRRLGLSGLTAVPIAPPTCLALLLAPPTYLGNTGPEPSKHRGMSSPDPLYELVEALRRTLARAPGSTASVSSSASAAASPLPPVIASPVAAPAPYSGSAEDCNGFLLQCSLALKMQPHSYPDDRAKVAFIISHLDGKARHWAEPLWTHNNPIVSSLPRFIEHLKEVFGKPEWDSSLDERLCCLKQGSMSVSDYALQFRTLAAASGWNKQALITTYRQGLDPRVRLHLAAYEDSIGLERFIQLSI